MTFCKVRDGKVEIQERAAYDFGVAQNGEGKLVTFSHADGSRCTIYFPNAEWANLRDDIEGLD